MQSRTPPPSSSFETLIEDLFGKNGAPNEAPKPSHPFSINSLEAAWELAAHSRASPSRGGEAPPLRTFPYGYDRAQAAHEISLDPERILSELGLHAGASEADVAVLRREFALRNHPDRVPLELRELATKRMMIANDLVDRYVARLRNAGR
jgi:hypothetical protein